MLRLICFLLFILHNFTVYSYCSVIFTSNTKNKKIYYISILVNIIIVAILLSSKIIFYEAIFMILYFLFVFLEIKLIYNDNLLKTFFISFCFSINFFSVKLILISIYSLVSNVSLSSIMQNYNSIIIFLILTFIFTIPSIMLFKKIFPVKYMNMIITNKNNIKFCIIIVAIIYIYLTVNSYLLYLEDSFLVNILNIKIGICAIFGFLTSILYGYIFSKLQLYVVKSENIEKEIKQDKIIIEKLKNEMLYDDLTSCFKRDFMEEKLDQLLENHTPFCAVFIDIDGLKITNDIYGHDEGDFYIKSVSGILNYEFKNYIVSRIGGDEFFILLQNTDIYTTMKYVIRCYEKVENISKSLKKPYQTSISYGVVEIGLDNKLSKKEIIDLADTYMYNFKKLRKKNRK